MQDIACNKDILRDKTEEKQANWKKIKWLYGLKHGGKGTWKSFKMHFVKTVDKF